MAVPQTVMKKRAASKAAATEKAKAVVQAKKKKATKKQVAFKRAEKYAKEYRQMEANAIRLRREARNAGNLYRDPEAKLALVIRIRGINGMAPRTTKILQLFRLRQIHNAVFVRLNKATMTMLRLVEPYITYGPPSLKTVRDLIYKRGYAKVNGQRLALNSNDLIEQNLGKYGIVCAEDLVHEIYTVGEHFRQANKFLWSFKLNSKRGGMARKATHFIEGGNMGNREKYINQFVASMI
mmetsp:Transcript_13092/g.41281  ORF Transcript_13092/g.41281 Transcript_13092/m.41281 type:complete len:238 (-) Transcript_13092:90-803(-)